MSSFSAERREKRLTADYDLSKVLSARTYNLVLGGVVLYGIIMNVILCATCKDAVMAMNPLAFLVGYFVSCIAGVLISTFSKNPIVSFIGYNLVVIPIGLALSITVEDYGGVDSAVVIQAFLYTAIITGCMIALSIVMPEFFSKLGGILLGSLIGLIIAEIVALFLGLDQIVISWVGAIIFSLYIGYDVYRSQQFVKTLDNAVDCALDIYLDIANLFLYVLEILGNNDD